jgi:hypothetical protein
MKLKSQERTILKMNKIGPRKKVTVDPCYAGAKLIAKPLLFPSGIQNTCPLRMKFYRIW